MVGPIDAEGTGGESVGFWFNYVTSTFDHTRYPHLGFFQGQILKYVYLRKWYLVEVKSKGKKIK